MRRVSRRRMKSSREGGEKGDEGIGNKDKARQKLNKWWVRIKTNTSQAHVNKPS